jgi:hypothetical protein
MFKTTLKEKIVLTHAKFFNDVGAYNKKKGENRKAEVRIVGKTKKQLFYFLNEIFLTGRHTRVEASPTHLGGGMTTVFFWV